MNRELNNKINISITKDDPLESIVNVIRDITNAGIKEGMNIADREQTYEFSVEKLFKAE